MAGLDSILNFKTWTKGFPIHVLKRLEQKFDVTFFKGVLIKEIAITILDNTKLIYVQLKQIYGIILGQRQTDFNNRLIIISEWASIYIRKERVIWELLIWINLIP